MGENKEILFKPNQTIMITNGKLSATQRKAYNIILYEAWSAVKLNKSQRKFKFNISGIKDKAGIKATDNWHLKMDLEAISDVKIEILKGNDKGDWGFFRLLNSAKKSGDSLEIDLPEEITEALLKNNFYTALDLLTIKNLDGKYAVILYEMAIRYQKKQIPEMTIEEFRLLTGTIERKSYNNFNNLKRFVLIPAIEEINSKTDILLDYTTSTQGKKVLTIKFTVKQKEGRQLISTLNEVTATTEIIPGQMTIDEALEVDPDQKELLQKILEPLRLSKKDVSSIQKYDIDIGLLQKYVSIIKKNRAAADNPTGLLIYSVKNKLDPENIDMILKSQKKQKPSNRNNFEQREYSEEYYANFFNNNSK